MTGTESDAPTPHDPYLAFRVPAYRIFAASYVLAVIGSQVFATAVQWDIYKLTNSEASLGWIGLINALPLMILALPAGHVVDVMPRRQVLIATQLVLILIPWTMAVAVHFVSPNWREALLYTLSGINAVTLTFARPARVALMPALVPREAYPNAFTWNSSIFETSSWIGPPIAGFLLYLGTLTTGHSEWAFAFSGLCLLACMVLTMLLPNPPATSSERSATWKSLVAGLKFVFRTELLLSAMSLDMLAVLFGGVVYLLPVFAKDILHVDALGFGFLKAATALGAATMAVWQAHHPMRRNVGRRLLWAVAGFGAATIVFGFSTSFWLSFMMLFLMGIFDNISVVVRQTLVQSLTPDSMRGRVSSVNMVFISASNDLGGAESGLTARLFGPIASVVGGGIGTILVVAAVAWKWPQLRRLQSLHGLQPVVYDDTSPLSPAVGIESAPKSGPAG